MPVELPVGCPDYVLTNLVNQLTAALPHLPEHQRADAERALRGAKANGVEAQAISEPPRRNEVEQVLRSALIQAASYLAQHDTVKHQRDWCLNVLEDVRGALGFADDHKPEPEGVMFEGEVTAFQMDGARQVDWFKVRPDTLIDSRWLDCSSRVRVTLLPEPTKGA